MRLKNLFPHFEFKKSSEQEPVEPIKAEEIKKLVAEKIREKNPQQLGKLADSIAESPEALDDYITQYNAIIEENIDRDEYLMAAAEEIANSMIERWSTATVTQVEIKKTAKEQIAAVSEEKKIDGSEKEKIDAILKMESMPSLETRDQKEKYAKENLSEAGFEEFKKMRRQLISEIIAGKGASKELADIAAEILDQDKYLVIQENPEKFKKLLNLLGSSISRLPVNAETEQYIGKELEEIMRFAA